MAYTSESLNRGLRRMLRRGVDRSTVSVGDAFDQIGMPANIDDISENVTTSEDPFDRILAGDFPPALPGATTAEMELMGARISNQTISERLTHYETALSKQLRSLSDIPPTVREVMQFAAEADYDLITAAHEGIRKDAARFPAFDGSIFSFNPVKTVGGSDVAVNTRELNGSAINSTQELSTMCYLGHRKRNSVSLLS